MTVATRVAPTQGPMGRGWHSICSICVITHWARGCEGLGFQAPIPSSNNHQVGQTPREEMPQPRLSSGHLSQVQVSLSSQHPRHPATETPTSTPSPAPKAFPRVRPQDQERCRWPSTSADSCIFCPTLSSYSGNSRSKGSDKSCSREMCFTLFGPALTPLG